jgi:probable DNA repair protein
MADLLARGGAILTGNQRAARTLRLAFDRGARADGLTTWQPPAIFAWDTWTAALYRQLLLEGHATRVLLNRSQELHLWQSVIAADPRWASLKSTASLADLAATAWQLLCAWRGLDRLRHLGVSEDTRSFQRWAQAFLRRCQTASVLSAAELEETLAAAIAAGKLAAPAPEILLVGFDRQTPAQQLLTTALGNAGIEVFGAATASPLSYFDEVGGSASKPVPVRHSFAASSRMSGMNSLHLAPAEDPAAELRHAAFWLRSFLLENPGTRVAVIVPDLPAERREIDRVFRQILAPELEDITAVPIGPWEFSLGQPLASVPLASTALQILRLASGPLPIATVSHLLLSPHFTITSPEAPEYEARAEFDAFEVRKSRSLRPEITLERLIALTEKRSSRLPALLSQLRSLHRTALKLLAGPAAGSIPKNHSAWSDHIRELLEAVGWALPVRLDSTEFQARRKWDSALDELASLDLLSARVSYTDALASLEAILQRTLFAPESREAPIQIMSPLEAAGSRFDALWFLRASDLNWPAPPAVHPFLGWRLQHELSMPGSDPARDAAHAQRVTARIADSAPIAIFSYARQTADGHQRPSPMLAALNLDPLAIPGEPAAPPAVALEVVNESAFVPLANLTVRGGAEILKLQAACAFRAFAEKRLSSAPLEAPQPGMDARESGDIVHKALEHLWTKLRSHSALEALAPAERSAQLSRSIDYSLARVRARLAADTAATPWDDAYLEIQRRRLHSLLTPWLEIERNRAPFEVVFHEEKETATIGPLTFDVRIDRVDRTLDPPHGEILIDYKTGNPQPRDWTTDRPDEPQLPLYAVLRSSSPASGPVAAVAFARIRAGKEMALHGYESRKKLLGKSAEIPLASLEDQIEDWNRLLTALAQDFADGDTRVLPKDYPATCKFCAQRLLCRLDPATLLVDPDTEAAEEEFA